MKILLLHDTLTSSSDSSATDVLDQVQSITSSLDSLGYYNEVKSVDFNFLNLKNLIFSKNFSIIFNLVESLNGSDRLQQIIPLLLEDWGVKFTGASSQSLFLTGNKLQAKRLASLSGISTPPAYYFNNSKLTYYLSIEPECFAPSRWLIKPIEAEASSSITSLSVITANNLSDLSSQLFSAQSKSHLKLFAEKYISGREFNISLLPDHRHGLRILPIAEIKFLNFSKDQPKILDYTSKWDPQSPTYINTPRSFSFSAKDKSLLTNLRNIAFQCWEVFSLTGYSRLDFRVDENNRPWLLEANANPCLSPDAGFLASANEEGLSTTDVYNLIISYALERFSI